MRIGVVFPGTVATASFGVKAMKRNSAAHNRGTRRSCQAAANRQAK